MALTSPEGPSRGAGGLLPSSFGMLLVSVLVSNVGSWMESVGVQSLVVSATGSEFFVSLAASGRFLPILALGLVGGRVADRVERTRAFLVAVTALTIIAFLAAGVAATGPVPLLLVYGVVVATGSCLAFAGPALMGLIPQLVRADQLPRASSMTVAAADLAGVLGPFLGGLAFSRLGAAWVFALNGLSCLQLAFVLVRIRARRIAPGPPVAAGTGGVREGLRHVAGSPLLRALLFTVTAQALLLDQVLFVLAAFNGIDLGQGAAHLGGLFAAFGLGGVAGAAAAPRLRARLPWVPLASGLFAVAGSSMVALSITTAFWPAAGTLVFAGAASSANMAVLNTAIQATVPEEFRGRVLSVWFMAAMGLPPLGGLAAGTIAEATGARTVLLLAGGACLAFAVLRPVLRGFRDARRTPRAATAGLAPAPEMAFQEAAGMAGSPDTRRG